jgi:hypothetical protein
METQDPCSTLKLNELLRLTDVNTAVACILYGLACSMSGFLLNLIPSFVLLYCPFQIA